MLFSHLHIISGACPSTPHLLQQYHQPPWPYHGTFARSKQPRAAPSTAANNLLGPGVGLDSGPQRLQYPLIKNYTLNYNRIPSMV